MTPEFMTEISKIAHLIEAVFVVLQDMGNHHSCSTLTKAKLRIAFEPFLSPELDSEKLLSLKEAQEIIESIQKIK